MSSRVPPKDRRLELVRDRLHEARSTWRTVDVIACVLRTLTVLLGALLVGLLADNLLGLTRGFRAAFCIAFFAGALYLVVGQILLRLTRPLTDEMVARHVEGRYPELDNRLINAVLLSKERIPDRVTRRMVASQLDETAHAVESYDMAGATSSGPLWKWGKWTAVLVLCAILYGVLFTRHFANAMQRLYSPTSSIAALTNTLLTVHPGDVECLQGESVGVEAHIQGVLPETAAIYYQDEQGTKTRKDMPFEGSFFAYQFTGLQDSFRYYVKAGDATSRTFTVSVRSRPAVQGIRVTYRYPAYTGLPDRTEASPTGNIKALVGTRIRLEATLDRPLSRAQLKIRYLIPGEAPGESDFADIDMQLPSPEVAAAEFEVTRSGQYTINVADEADVPNDPAARQIAALPDEPPFVKVVNPGKDVLAKPEDKVALLAEVKDDFSLRGLGLFVQTSAGEDWEKLRTWPYKGTATEVREGAMLDLKELRPAPGDVLSYYFRAEDGRPGRDATAGKSRVYQISIVDKAVAEAEGQQREAALRNVIKRLIAMQKENLGATQKLGGWRDGREGRIEDEPEALELFQARAGTLVNAEEEVYSTATDAVRQYTGGEIADIVEGLAGIAAGEMTQAVDRLGALGRVAGTDRIGPVADSAAETEQQVIELLERLLEDPGAFLAERLRDRGDAEELVEGMDDLMDEHERADRMLEAVKRFQEEQRKVIELTKQVGDVPVDEFTEEEEQRLEEIIEQELKWAKYFQETATDLSKLNPQDFALSSMAKEHLEVYSEIQKAANAASQKAAEIATAMEEGAAAKAKKIEENIEKWLLENPDRVAWHMEGPDVENDIPLADLPDELEDLIGDLLEDEEDLLEEAEDSTAGWLGSPDEGIGWDTMDGPLDSMTAKGVTGNMLPNASEIGGRSGEGRTGKSSGQHVEETATGKGGRKTPSRLTPDPFEAGVVRDYSSEPATGATGGGKSSGEGREGFRGPAPPASQQKLKRLANQQQQLIDQAERLDFGLEKYRYPRADLPRTIEMMKEIESQLAAGTYVPTAANRHKVVLSNLREVKALVDKQKQLRRDRSALLPEELREEIAASLHEDVPREYRDMVDNYFRALSETGSP